MKILISESQFIKLISEQVFSSKTILEQKLEIPGLKTPDVLDFVVGKKGKIGTEVDVESAKRFADDIVSKTDLELKGKIDKIYKDTSITDPNAKYEAMKSELLGNPEFLENLKTKVESELMDGKNAELEQFVAEKIIKGESSVDFELCKDIWDLTPDGPNKAQEFKNYILKNTNLREPEINIIVKVLKGEIKVDVAPEPQQKKFNIDIAKKNPPKPKLQWDYKVQKINDNLEIVLNPKGSDVVAEVRNKNDKSQLITLKKRADIDGEFFFMSAKMSNPRDAGIAFQKLKSLIPSGSRFGEPSRGSLSTDSFYSMIRRSKDFIPKVKDYILLNSVGKYRFREFIKNSFEAKSYPNEMQWNNYEDAKLLLDAINNEILKFKIPELAKITKSYEGFFQISIPNIQFIVP